MHRISSMKRSVGALVVLACLLQFVSSGAAESSAGLELFESKVRPLLIDQCYRCHSAQAEKLKGNLRLDSREGALEGGESGPAIVPGDPEHSLLVKAVRYADPDLQMPPKSRLSPEAVAALEQWIKLGAPEPASSIPVSASGKPDKLKHWAFQPVRRPPIPSVRESDRVQDPIDAFVEAKLEAHGLALSPPADKRTLLRRVAYDLTGLPPTQQELADFVADRSPDAFARVVDRLLASPHYGERWARHWLDVARYADTKGYVFEEERRYPYAYTYRDYVVRAFNEDLPFDQFVREQLAADLLPSGTDKRSLAALGYLTLGRRFLNNQPDIIDDRIDVVTRGLMGLTVACARCHDHKYDPITSRDYYALYGVFASCSEPAEEPLLGGPQPPQYAEYEQEHQRRFEQLKTFRTQHDAEVRSEVRLATGRYLLTALESVNEKDASKTEALARQRKLDPTLAHRWLASLQASPSKLPPRIFAPWVVLSQCGEDDLAQSADAVLRPLLFPETGPSMVNPFVAEAFAGDPPQSMEEVADRYGNLFAEVERAWEQREKTASASHVRTGAPDSKAAGFADPDLEELRQVLYNPSSPANVPDGELTRLYDVPSIQKLRSLQRKVEELDATHPGAPARAMALQDNPVPQTPHVFLRGNPSNLGPTVPREFVAFLEGGHPKPFEKGSGRLELAEAIANPNNPLTARVLVNRVWLQFFGAGLVRTPSDFGMRSDPPTHPELLDYLASRFMEEGWSLKKLQRWIVLSSAYQQSSADSPHGLQVDPANQWLWKMNRRRLDFEAMRDSILAAAGVLDLSIGGHAVDLFAKPFATRRTIYGFVERQNLPSLFRTFDFASPDTTSSQRFTTTVPQQGLFMMNSPFAIEQAKRLAARPEVCRTPFNEERVRALYERLLQRDPTESEVRLALEFIEDEPKLEPFRPDPIVWQYGYGRYLPAERKLAAFEPLPHFTGDAWQGGAALPDSKLGWVFLNSTGGHPGNDHAHAAVRRWVAPRTVTISVSGALKRSATHGDGIEAWILSSRNGEVGHWILPSGDVPTPAKDIPLQRGDTLDFIVDCRANPDSDGFSWNVTLTDATSATGTDPGEGAHSWSVAGDFKGPQPAPVKMDAWDRYAQVLLMANEFVFLD